MCLHYLSGGVNKEKKKRGPKEKRSRRSISSLMKGKLNLKGEKRKPIPFTLQKRPFWG